MAGLSFNPQPRRAVFVSYHHHGDQRFYDSLLTTLHDRMELLTDNSLDRRIESSDHTYIMRQIREHYLRGSSCAVVLCGVDTWRRKYVDWEIQASLDQQMGLVGVRLPTLQLQANGGTIKPARLQDNIDTGYAQWVQWAEASVNPSVLIEAIEKANTASKRLIVNSRQRLDRNQ